MPCQNRKYTRTISEEINAGVGYLYMGRKGGAIDGSGEMFPAKTRFQTRWIPDIVRTLLTGHIIMPSS